MASIDPRLQAIVDARLQGRGPDAMAPHNSDWPPYKMYPEIYDAIDSGSHEGYMLDNSDEVPHSYGGRYAQYEGRPLAPDMPNWKDLRRLEGTSDPGMRRRFEDEFGTQALERADRGVRQLDKSYIPLPRSRPLSAPMGPAADEYEGDQSGMSSGSYPTVEQPRPDEVYDYMPSLKDRVKEQMLGAGTSRDLRGDFGGGTKFDRAFGAFAGQDTGNIQDLRARMIEDMIRRGGQQKDINDEEAKRDAFEGMMPLIQNGETLDQIMQRHLQELREGR